MGAARERACSVSYRFYSDGIFFGIVEVPDAPDNVDTFNTFIKARTAMVKALRSRASDYLVSAKEAAKMQVDEVEQPDQD